ncbi:MAG: alkaline phosphatase family protein [Pirellulaceae bacterium]
MSKPKVLLIGWDAADWKMFRPLLEDGEAPAIERMINGGVMGNLATLHPVLSPMLWNSIATGKRPWKHGILGFTDVNPHTNAVGPSLSSSRTCKAIWNILSQEGYKTHVVNWFASHPAEPINGICISEVFSTMPQDFARPWPLGNDVVQPPEQKDFFEELRLHPTELDGELLQLFAPEINELDQLQDQRVNVLAKLIAEAITIHNATTHILENEDWDFVATYYGCIDHFCHGFMYYHPPQMPGISDNDFRIFKDVIPNVCRFHDRMLARLVQLAGDDATIIVCSDHGFHSDHLRPLGTPLVPAGAAVWHRDQGMLLAQGPGICRDELIHGANLLDITPTILQVFGLPVGRDMDGRPLLEAFDKTNGLDTISSWEDRPGEHPDGMHPADLKMSAEESQAVLDQFVALGYIDPPAEDADKAVADAQRETSWNLARAYIDGGQTIAAVALLEQLVDESPDRRDFTMTLSRCLQHLGLRDEAFDLAFAVLDAQDPDSFHNLLTQAELEISRGEYRQALERLEKIKLRPGDFSTRGASNRVLQLMLLGTVYMKLRNWEEAEDHFRQVLDVDEDFPRAYLGLAQCYHRLRRFDEAIDAALCAVELEHQLAPAHYELGMALAKSGQRDRAIDAFITTLHYSPNDIFAHKRLASVYARIPGCEEQSKLHWDQARLLQARQQEEQATEFQAEIDEFKKRNATRVEKLRPFYVELTAKEQREAEEQAKTQAEAAEAAEGADQQEPSSPPKTFVVVSGLPRSGTSLVMQMLQAGGMEIMTDGEREADEDNPQGYLEWEAIKKIKSEPELLDQAEGKVTKVISMLLSSLPRNHRYLVIFVMRPIKEIVASQQKMIERRGSTGADLDEEALEKSLKRHRKEILDLTTALPMNVLTVGYRRILDNPDHTATQLAKFLGKDRLPHPENMAAVIRPDLYRNRLKPRKDGDAASVSKKSPD